MTKKNIFLISIVVVLAAIYVVYFTGWFGPKFIRIEHTVRSARGAANGGTGGRQANSVTFSLHKNYRLTSVKVVPSAEYQTNKYTHPLWQLVSPKGSKPIEAFAYGFALPGMAPAVANAEPDPLVPGVEYCLVVESKSVKGEHNFSIPASATSRR